MTTAACGDVRDIQVGGLDGSNIFPYVSPLPHFSDCFFCVVSGTHVRLGVLLLLVHVLKMSTGGIPLDKAELLSVLLETLLYGKTL